MSAVVRPVVWALLHLGGAAAAHGCMRSYHRFSLLAFVASNPDQFVICATAGCEYIWEKTDPSAVADVRCPSCEVLRCGRCFANAHGGARCADANGGAADASAEAVQAALGADAKQCPRCSAWIEKDPGSCDKMQCRCGHRFCFRCGADNARCSCTPAFHAFWDNHANRPDYGASAAAPPSGAHGFPHRRAPTFAPPQVGFPY
jgi:hypothetical protein